MLKAMTEYRKNSVLHTGHGETESNKNEYVLSIISALITALATGSYTS